MVTRIFRPTVAHRVPGTGSGEAMHSWKSLISIFLGFSSSISKNFILAGGAAVRGAIILYGLHSFLIFPYFLRS